jgi:hypothetical protein
MNVSIILFFISILTACTNSTKNKINITEISKPKDTLHINTLPISTLDYDTLPFITYKKIERYIQIIKKRKIDKNSKYLIKEIEKDNFQYYLVQYCLDSEIRIQVLYNFLYDKKNKKLYFYNTLKDKKYLIN